VSLSEKHIITIDQNYKGEKIFMSEVVEFLSAVKTFYIATVDSDKPRVRPFGIAVEYEGKIYFVTNNQKAVYRQLKANPNFEVSATDKDGRWIRLAGKAVFEDNIEVKKKAFEISPNLANIYKTPDNPIFEVFYVAEGEAVLYSFNDEPKKLKV